MKSKFVKIALMSAALSASALFNVANAGLITANGSIDTGTEVDVWSIEVITSGDFTFDVLAYENPSDDFFNNGIDNDHLDSYIYLFATDLNGALMGRDDDGGLGTDGSTHGYDSLMNVTLTSGSYVLAIGDYRLTETEARAAFNGDNASDMNNGQYAMSVSSDADFTIEGATAPTSVPEPSTIAMFALGLMGLFSRKLKK